VGNETCGSFSDAGGGDSSGGFCVEAAGAGESCEDTNGYCIEGYVCIGTGNGAECLQTCTPNNPNCPNGFSCEQLTDGSGACFERGNGQEGDNCQSMTDCAEDLVCIGGILAATCYYECDLQNPSCPFEGQTCVEVSGADTGICSPVGGTDGTSTGNDNGGGTDGTGTDTGGGSTGGDTSGGTSGGTTDGCVCDQTVVCDPDISGNSFCECDPECTPCACDGTYACDEDGYGSMCNCDTECLACECDGTFACDDNCELCDPECSGTASGCAATPQSGQANQPWLILAGALLALMVLRRREGRYTA